MGDGTRAHATMQEISKRLDKLEETQSKLSEVMAEQTKKLAEIMDLLKDQMERSTVSQDDDADTTPQPPPPPPQSQEIKAADMELREAKWIVCTRNIITPSRRGGDRYRAYLQFHAASSSGSIEKDVLPPLYTSYHEMCMVRMEGSIYIIGGKSVRDEPEHNPDPKNLVNYTGACRLSSDGARWEEIEPPFPKATSTERTCAPLDGKLYCFKSSSLLPEVFDPQLGTWTKLLGKCPGSTPSRSLTMPVVPHCSRVLARSSDCSLWAYHPPTATTAQGTWEHLASGFYHWDDVVAVADNVIYVHDLTTRCVFIGYDLDASKWLDVVWSSKRCADYNVKFTRLQFDALGYLGDGLFELVRWEPRTSRNEDMLVYILKFKSDYDRATSTLRLTPVASRVHHLPEDMRVRNLIPPLN